MVNVRFNYADVSSLRLKNKTRLKAFIQNIFFKEKKLLTKINYVFCSDKYLLDINRRFLKHNDLTDIITFDLSEGRGIIGEVYVSIERVKDNAKIHHTQYGQEILRVIFHGALHLCGYRDKKKSEITVMRQKEEEYLRLFEKNFS